MNFNFHMGNLGLLPIPDLGRYRFCSINLGFIPKTLEKSKTIPYNGALILS